MTTQAGNTGDGAYKNQMVYNSVILSLNHTHKSAISVTSAFKINKFVTKHGSDQPLSNKMVPLLI